MRRVSVRDVPGEACALLGVDLDDVMTGRRTKPVCDVRILSVALIRALDFPYTTAARVLCLRSHVSAIHENRRFEQHQHEAKQWGNRTDHKTGQQMVELIRERLGLTPSE